MPETPNPLAIIAIARRVVQAAHDADDGAVVDLIDEMEKALTEYDEAVAEVEARDVAAGTIDVAVDVDIDV